MGNEILEGNFDSFEVKDEGNSKKGLKTCFVIEFG